MIFLLVVFYFSLKFNEQTIRDKFSTFLIYTIANRYILTLQIYITCVSITKHTTVKCYRFVKHMRLENKIVRFTAWYNRTLFGFWRPQKPSQRRILPTFIKSEPTQNVSFRDGVPWPSPSDKHSFFIISIGLRCFWQWRQKTHDAYISIFRPW